MLTPALLAAERIREVCPVRTHYQQQAAIGRNGRPTKIVAETHRLTVQRQRAAGKSVKEIAAYLKISDRAVKKHMAALRLADDPDRGGRPARPVEIRGKRYDSLERAAAALHISFYSVKRLVAEGKGRYV